MKVLYCALLSLTTIIYLSEGKNYLIQHTKTKKYLAQWNGVNEELISLTIFPQYAQTFQISKHDDGSLSFITEDGLAVIDKTYGCEFNFDTNLQYYTTVSGLENQLFFINNVGTIGSKCCQTCVLVPTSDYTHLVVRNYTCIYETNDDWKFKVSRINSSVSNNISRK